VFIDLDDNVGLASLPQGLFAGVCSLQDLHWGGIDSAAFATNTFAGFPSCEVIRSNVEASEMCEAQQHVFVEGSCDDQSCERGECSACHSEHTCTRDGWGSWGVDDDEGYEICSVPFCEEGKEPNTEERACEACGVGKYSDSYSVEACRRCEAGMYSDAEGATACEWCEDGEIGGMDSSTCVPITGTAATADHAWDFRSCTDGVPVGDKADGSDLEATLMNEATCTPEGVVLDGVDDYVDLDDWEWGGTLSFEVYVKLESVGSWAVVLCFGNGPGNDNLYLGNHGISPDIVWSVRRYNAPEAIRSESIWDLSVWQHVVVTTSGSTMTIYKDGTLVDTRKGHEPRTITRLNHYLGRSEWEEDDIYCLHGSIAYFRVWHGVALGPDEVAALYNERGLM
jgi:hypothetical protein